ncbi:MAG: hypothetical protein HY433_01815 [Candidatus Liptonbacteria bacterium]|nr:hypothetical protein [Candidatus Liptonbacteria bacterium]
MKKTGDEENRRKNRVKKTGEKIELRNNEAAAAIRGIPLLASFSSRSAWEENVWRTLIAKFTILREPKKLSTALELLITAKERSLLLRRAAAIDRILAGTSYRKIGEELWLTHQTISGIKKALNEKKYRSYYERGKTERKKRIYSPGPQSSRNGRGFSGRRVRTKYGTFTIPQ